VVCVTLGLLKELDGDEREAVLAHELAHLKNGGSSVLTVAGFPATVALGAMGAAVESMDGRALVLGYFGAAALLPFVSFVLVTLPGTLVLSRYGEYAADRGAVAITGDPAALARALERLGGASDVPETDMRLSAGFNAFCIVPAGYGSLPVPWTHPPTRERIRRLRDLAAEMES
jgi:heat shock protein HtpX